MPNFGTGCKMVSLILLHILLLESGQLIFPVVAILVDQVSSGAWDGVGLYISVKREAIQKKLDAFHCSLSSKCDEGPRLFIPETLVLPNLQHRGHHPLYIDVGYMTSHDFNEYLEDNPSPLVSVSGLEVTITIPLLAGTSDGPPIYALSLAMFYERSRGDIPKTNFLYPYIPVDEIRINDYGVIISNESDEFRLSFNQTSPYCMPPASIVKEEFEKFVLGNFQFGLPAPDFSFCDRHSFKNKFCSNAKRIKCGVSRYAPNLCTKWTSDVIEHCATTVEIEKITPGFRDIFLLGDDPIHILASESNRYNSVVSLKYPGSVS